MKTSYNSKILQYCCKYAEKGLRVQFGLSLVRKELYTISKNIAILGKI